MSASAKGVRWAYLGMTLGGVASILANVAHALLPASPPAGSVIAAAFWPVALFVTIEILAKNSWPAGGRWTLLRWGGTVPVAAVTAVVSYRHMSGLLGAWGEDPLTATIGPVAVDGLLVMSTGAIIAAGSRIAESVAVGDLAVDEATVQPVLLARQLEVPTFVASSPDVTGVGILGTESSPTTRSYESLEPTTPAAAPTAKPAVVPDGELARIVREAVTGHADGWGKVKAAIEAAGYSVGNTGRVKAAIAQRKADLPDEPRRGLAAVGGGR